MIPILYDFAKYDSPRKGLFRVEKYNGEYSSEGVWEIEEKELIIIGEIDINYVEKLVTYNENKNKTYLLPIGVHKSRLIKWCNIQLTMF